MADRFADRVAEVAGLTAKSVRALAERLERWTASYGADGDGKPGKASAAILEVAQVCEEAGLTAYALTLRSSVLDLALQAQELAAYAAKLRELDTLHTEITTDCAEQTDPGGRAHPRTPPGAAGPLGR